MRPRDFLFFLPPLLNGEHFCHSLTRPILQKRKLRFKD